MLDRNVFVSHGLRLVLRIDQDFIQIRAHVDLTASAYLWKLLNLSLRFICKHLCGDVHLRYQIFDQAVFDGKKTV